MGKYKKLQFLELPLEVGSKSESIPIRAPAKMTVYSLVQKTVWVYLVHLYFHDNCMPCEMYFKLVRKRLAEHTRFISAL